MSKKVLLRSVCILLSVVAVMALNACILATPAETVQQPAADAGMAPADNQTSTEPAAATQENTEEATVSSDGAQVAIFKNEYTRIYYTDFSGEEGTITFRVENLTDDPILIMTPLDRSQELEDAQGSVLIDGAPHMAVPNSSNYAAANGFCIYLMTTATGPDAEGYLTLETLDENAKTAEFVQEFYITDINEEVLATIMLPVIDLTAPSYFPLPSIDISTFSATTLSGEALDGSYFSDHKLTMINFWATWCGPCVEEMPYISALHEEYADQGFAVLGVLVWDEGSEQSALDFLNESGISYPVVAYDTVPVFSELAGTQFAIPFTIFVDSQGTQIGDVYVGGDSKEGWATEINKMLLQVG